MAKTRAIDLEREWNSVGQRRTKCDHGIHRPTWMDESEESVRMPETRIRSLWVTPCESQQHMMPYYSQPTAVPRSKETVSKPPRQFDSFQQIYSLMCSNTHATVKLQCSSLPCNPVRTNSGVFLENLLCSKVQEESDSCGPQPFGIQH